MTNNIVLDVAIGLTFIYLIYSLLATTINEFVAIILAYRSRMLEKGIEQMLDGKSYSYYWWDKVANFFLWINYKAKTHDQTKKNNENDPGIKPEDNFFIKNGLDKPTRTQFKRVKLNAKANLFAANITNHPLYKRSAENSLLYKKPAYLSSSTFSDILLDILGSGGSNQSGQPVLMKDIISFIDNRLKENPDLKRILKLYAEQANGDVQRFKFLIENWYDATMNRVSGWYKKQANKVLFIIGLVMAIAFNISTIDIVNRLSTDKTVRDAFVSSAINYIERKNDSISSGKTSYPEKTSAATTDSSKITDTATGKVLEKAANTPTVDTAYEKARHHIEQIKKLYTETVETNNAMGLGWGDFGYKDMYKKYQEDSIAYANPSPGQNSNIERKKAPVAPDQKSTGRKVGYVFNKAISPRNLIGFLITALAISLGAPFWFDLLNRFVNLRVSGKKPGDTTSTASSSKAASLNQKPDPTAKG